MIKGLKSDWSETKKIFRYMNRTTFSHPAYPFKIDMSIVKSSKFDSRNKPIPSYKIEESGVFTNPETFEIEIELDNNLMKPFLQMTSPPNTPENAEKIKTVLLKLIKFVLSGLQNTPYPQPYPVIDVYFVNGKSFKNNGFIPTKSSHVANNFRLPILQNIIKAKEFVSAQSNKKDPPLDIQVKKFKSGIEEDDIFKGCDSILTDIENGLYPYNTDGLIFTPLEYGVGCTKLDEKAI